MKCGKILKEVFKRLRNLRLVQKFYTFANNISAKKNFGQYNKVYKHTNTSTQMNGQTYKHKEGRCKKKVLY